MMTTGSELDVAPVVPSERKTALQLIFQDLESTRRNSLVQDYLVQATHGTLSLEGLLRVKHQDEIIGASWCHVLPGKTAALSAPQLKPGAAGDTTDLLLAEMDRYSETADVEIAQCLVPMDSEVNAAALCRAGFRRVSLLMHMTSSRENFPETAGETCLEYQSCELDQMQRMAKLVESTYQQSLDCTDLNGSRKMTAVLEGYRHTGVFDPERWLFLRFRSQDVGCLLLTDHLRENQWELMYLGLIPEVRGQGWGLEAIRYAQWLVSQTDRDQLVLSVDAANFPAVNTYLSAGFSVCDRQWLFLKTYP